MTRSILRVVVFCSCLLVCSAFAAQGLHPTLLLTPEDVSYIRENLDSSPSFISELETVREEVNTYFQSRPDVPQPKDAGGGYSHEQHKRNAIAIRQAGVLFQLTGSEAYLEYAADLLLAYADMYPDLPEHPMKKEQTPGRLFWQSLNESVWLVHAIQGFDAVVDYLPEEQVRRIVTQLIRPMADFLSEGSPQTFDRIHNHGTWAVAAVGMTGYVLDDESYVKKALYGLKEDGSAGFLTQLDTLLSPDGYYSEGPYYQRYALMPIVLFSQSIEKNDPDVDIFQYRDGIVLKAILACIELSYGARFFPINDAIREKGLSTAELRYALAIAYGLTQDHQLLSIISAQNKLVLTRAGFDVAVAIDQGLSEHYVHDSKLFKDGPRGKKGGLAVIRHGNDAKHQAVVYKATAQGMGHGHFDKLHWMYYDNGREIVADYGAARFLNIEAKHGGRYLPENKSWAKQTVAHNTLVVNETSHFNANVQLAEQVSPTIEYVSFDKRKQVVAASMQGAYDDVTFDRTLALLDQTQSERPVVVDVVNVHSSEPKQYDLPLHFKGQVIATSPPLVAQTDTLHPLGEDSGYQHLWLVAAIEVNEDEQFSMTWLLGDRFYTYSVKVNAPFKVLMTELGANDPERNLRREQALIVRVNNQANSTFVNVLESHGEYNAAEEYTLQSEGSVTEISLYQDSESDLIELKWMNSDRMHLALSYESEEQRVHEMDIVERTFSWSGYFGLFVGNRLIQ